MYDQCSIKAEQAHQSRTEQEKEAMLDSANSECSRTSLLIASASRVVV